MSNDATRSAVQPLQSEKFLVTQRNKSLNLLFKVLLMAEALSEHTPTDARHESRYERAERYFETDLSGQRKWYSRRANQFKRRAQVLSATIIVAGATTTFLQVLHGSRWVALCSAAVGALVAVAEGWRQVAKYDESWAAYRIASEKMKRERRLYTNGAGDYDISDEEKAFLDFVEQIESVIAEEQRIFWSKRDDSNARSRRDKTTKSGAQRDGND